VGCLTKSGGQLPKKKCLGKNESLWGVVKIPGEGIRVGPMSKQPRTGPV